MRKLAAAANCPMSEAAAVVYLEQLAPYSELQLAEAIDDVIRHWAELSKLPPVAVILESVQACMLEAQFERQKIELESKPPDWVALSAKFGFAGDQIRTWLEESKLVMQEYFRRGATAKGAEDYHSQLRQIRHDLGYADLNLYKP